MLETWKRDKEATNQIAKRNKSASTSLRDYTTEMVECGSRLVLELARESVRLVRKGPRESEPRQPREDGDDDNLLER